MNETLIRIKIPNNKLMNILLANITNIYHFETSKKIFYTHKPHL